MRERFEDCWNAALDEAAHIARGSTAEDAITDAKVGRMTFKQWWATISSSGNTETEKQIARMAWNAAIDETLKSDALVNASSMEVSRVEALKNS
jgi:hypothetical protein